jgi:FHS family L-fucose permease-like MFS transporter
MLVTSTTGNIEESGAPQPLFPKGLGMPFSLVTALFFLWGVTSNLNDVLIRQFMKSFSLTRFQAGLVQSAFYLGYFLLAVPGALLMRKKGYKFGIVLGLVLFATGSFLFWPAAVAGKYGYFLVALFVIASGSSFLETASNPFIAQVGAPQSAARRLNFSQAFNPLGAITGVLCGTVFIFSGIELTPAQVSTMQAANTYQAYLRHETMRVVVPYLVVGAVALLWAVMIARTKFPVIAREHESGGEDHGSFRELLRYPNFLFAIVAQFLYVGAQTGTWSYFIQYVQDTTHQPEKIAGYFLTGTLVAFGLGRFSSAALMRYVKPATLMGIYCVANIVAVAIGVAFPGWIGLWAIFITSFFMSVMFPTIFALGIEGLDQNTKIGGSLIVMAIVGGAVLTPLMGLISQTRHSIAQAYLVPFFCYCGIALYAFVGVRMKRRELA